METHHDQKYARANTPAQVVVSEFQAGSGIALIGFTLWGRRCMTRCM